MSKPEFGDNELHSPFEIVEARQAQHAASQNQKTLAGNLAQKHGELAEAQFLYYRALSDRIKQLHADGIPGAPSEGKGLAITTCEVVAKGEESIAMLRRRRDELEGEVKEADKETFRASADRRAVDALGQWSMHRDLRTDAPPIAWDQNGEVQK